MGKVKDNEGNTLSQGLKHTLGIVVPQPVVIAAQAWRTKPCARAGWRRTPPTAQPLCPNTLEIGPAITSNGATLVGHAPRQVCQIWGTGREDILFPITEPLLRPTGNYAPCSQPAYQGENADQSFQ